MSEITRRDFLRITAAATAGVVLASCAKATEEPTRAPEPTATKAPQPTATPTPEPAAAEKASPMIIDLVKSGALPPLSERLPVSPRVIEPFESIGTFGGTLHQGWNNYKSWGRYETQIGYFQYNMTCSEVIPDLVEGFSWSDDVKTLTLNLREGHKWSDGAPLTTDDIVFWWEDYQLNEELSPNGPRSMWAPGGTPAEFKKVSDTQVTISFVVPAPFVLDALGRGGVSRDPLSLLPKHYVEKWHADYSEDAAKLATEEGFDDWTKAFMRHVNGGSDLNEPERPTLFVWNLESSTTDRASHVRNPYFHHVDTDENQLPYIDRLDWLQTGDAQVAVLKATSGEFDEHSFNLSLVDMPVLRENAEAGDYHVVLSTIMRCTDPLIAFNLTIEDAVLHDLFNAKDFRVALSIAINRDAINDAIWFGLAKPHACTPGPWMSFYQDSWATTHTEYDPDTANQLLDGIGLTEKDADGFRVRPDTGERIELLIDVSSPEGPKVPTLEMVVVDWEKVGIKATVNLMEGSLASERQNANQHMIATAHSDRGTLYGRYDPAFFGLERAVFWGMEWMYWFKSNGEQGVEPPQEIKDQKALFDHFRTLVVGTPEFNEVGAKYYTWFAEEVPMIGIVGQGPQPIVVKNRLKNFPEENTYWLADTNFYGPYLPSQWWLEE